MRVLMAHPPGDQAALPLAALRGAGFVVAEADGAEDALSIARHGEYDLIVLNAPRGAMDMSAPIRALRATGLATPILVVIASTVFATAAALGAGADDVMPLAQANTELVARARALVRRSLGVTSRTIAVGPLVLDVDAREVRVADRVLGLTAREFAVLEVLAQRRNRPVRKDAIIAAIYALDGDEPCAKIIDVFICKMRRKLSQAGAPDLIDTVWGVGYRLAEPGAIREQASPAAARAAAARTRQPQAARL